MQVVSRRLFNWDDQHRFAHLSGDINPMHMDPVAARRTSAGRPVVHGVHLLLWALDELLDYLGPRPAARLKVNWSHFVHVGETASVAVKSEGKSSLRAEILVDQNPVAAVAVFATGKAPSKESPAACPTAWDSPHQPADLGMEDLAGLAGALALASAPADAAAAFPRLASVIGGLPVAGLLTLSRLVGMVCPGLHSIFAGLDVSIAESGGQAPDGVLHKVLEADPRFRFITQEVWGAGLRGTVEAFARVPPASQPEISELAAQVRPGEFAGSTALVVGGSRGLGEATAKLLAAGGADLIITYRHGKADAERVADSIRAAGRNCEVIQYDARDAAANPLGGLERKPAHAYYFATGPITQSRAPLFDCGRFDEYCDLYVKGFARLCLGLRESAAGPVRIFYPSSVYVAADEHPSGLSEYAVAKAAGEALCEELNRTAAGLEVIVRRLPRLRTDQTASFLEAEAPAATGEVMLEAIREVQRSRDGAS